ncbi:MAG: FGGY family carbohydrate kinase [Methylococcales bacterium]
MAAPITQAIALDLGTTSIKAGVVDDYCQLSVIDTLPAPEITVKQGRYESNALAYIEKAEQLLIKCLHHSDKTPSLGIAYQRSSFLLWEKTSGKPVTPLISWQDNRGASCCAALQSMEQDIQNLTGLRLAPYYFAPKLNTLLQEHPELRTGLEQGVLLAGTLDCFLLWRWSGGQYYQTDVSMAARTLLMDIQRQQWSSELCSLFSIPQHSLPKIQPSTGLNQSIIHKCILQTSIADQSAALIASVTSDPGEVLVNLGTGGFVIRYLPDQQQLDTKNYLRTLVYQDHLNNSFYAIEGTLNAITAALSPYPFKDCQIADLAERPEIFCLTEPTGIGAPYFRADLGLVFSESVEQLSQQRIVALLLEGIIFRVVRILEEFNQQYAVNKVILSGGLSDLACLQQGIAQCCQIEVHRLVQKESTLLGVGLLASGLPANIHRKTELIQVTTRNLALTEKYHFWKSWLDQMLL